jgi:hypothetical protein
MISDKDSEENVFPTRIPAEKVAEYSPTRDPDSEADIARYVEIESSDEVVQHVELLKVDYILAEKYEIWDVITDKDRWWVITNMTNLYSQKHFTSLDFTLSFHVGLMARLRSRDTTNIDASPFSEIERRREQAFERYERAVEPEDFQAIGLLLRECLLQLISVFRDRAGVELNGIPPKAGDFRSWYELLVNNYCPGERNKQLRHYMKSVGIETWQLVSWLVHDRKAHSAAASIALHSFDTLFGHMGQLMVRHETKDLDICPKCSSRQIRSHYDHTIKPSGEYYSTCGSCGWSDQVQG